jgi:hypothetical protein
MSGSAVAPYSSACTGVWSAGGSLSGRYHRASCPWAESRRSRTAGVRYWARQVSSGLGRGRAAGPLWQPLGAPVALCGPASATAGASAHRCRASRPAGAGSQHNACPGSLAARCSRGKARYSHNTADRPRRTVSVPSQSAGRFSQDPRNLENGLVGVVRQGEPNRCQSSKIGVRAYNSRITDRLRG